jgi:hypothetical protein
MKALLLIVLFAIPVAAQQQQQPCEVERAMAEARAAAAEARAEAKEVRHREVINEVEKLRRRLQRKEPTQSPRRIIVQRNSAEMISNLEDARKEIRRLQAENIVLWDMNDELRKKVATANKRTIGAIAVGVAAAVLGIFIR